MTKEPKRIQGDTCDFPKSKEPVGEGWRKTFPNTKFETYDDVKDFVRSAIASAVKEERQRIVGVLEGVRHECVESETREHKIRYSGFNEALSDAISIITKQ